MEEESMNSFKSKTPCVTPEFSDSKITEYLEKLFYKYCF